MRALLLAAVLLLGGASAPGAGVPAAGRPGPLQGFDGRWVLDAKRSEFGGASYALRAREDQVATDGERVSVNSRYVRAGGDTVSLVYVYRADGDATNSMRGQSVQTHGRHAGAALEFVSVIKILLLELRSEERWSLAARGDTLVMDRTAHSPLGIQHQVLYFGHADGRGR